MSYRAETAVRTQGETLREAVELSSDSGAAAEIWPFLGFNVVRWQVPAAGGPRDLIYAPEPAVLFERPTRGGIPVLFPFPNRIRNGYFVWRGREYQLPKNDPAGVNAIHGFTPRDPWEMMNWGANETGAWAEGEFYISQHVFSGWFWPTNCTLDLRIRLNDASLRYEAVVRNWDGSALPFGLGYHPYFIATPDCRVQTPARARWVLEDNLPTGDVEPLPSHLDLREPRSVADLMLDDVYTDFPDAVPDRDGLVERGRVEYPGAGVLRVRTAPAFRELVLFTPPHRQAVCLEPYTCPTDAVNLTAAGRNVGWQVLGPGEQWVGVVEYVWEQE